METVEIGNEDYLLRRFPLAHPNYIRPDGTVSSYAYCPDKADADGLSVDLEKLTHPKATVLDPNKFGLLRISAGSIRSIPDLDCKHNPIPANAAHSLIIGKITKGKRNQLIDFSKTIPHEELR
jgi:hypothetical protein